MSISVKLNVTLKEMYRLNDEYRKAPDLSALVCKLQPQDKSNTKGDWKIDLSEKEIVQVVETTFEDYQASLKQFMDSGDTQDLEYEENISDETINRYLRPLAQAYYVISCIAVE